MKCENVPNYCRVCKEPIQLVKLEYQIDGITYKLNGGTRTCQCDSKSLVVFRLNMKD